MSLHVQRGFALELKVLFGFGCSCWFCVFVLILISTIADLRILATSAALKQTLFRLGVLVEGLTMM